MLANPTNVKREAQGLGMVEATDVTSITLPEDVVQTGRRRRSLPFQELGGRGFAGRVRSLHVAS